MTYSTFESMFRRYRSGFLTRPPLRSGYCPVYSTTALFSRKELPNVHANGIDSRQRQRRATDSRRRALGRDDAEYDRHDRRRAVHHYSPDHRGDGRAAGDARLDFGSRPGRLRWAGLGRTRSGAARLWRFLSLSGGDLWRAKVGPPDVVSFHLATHFQRAAFDRIGRHRLCPKSKVYLYRPTPPNQNY